MKQIIKSKYSNQYRKRSAELVSTGERTITELELQQSAINKFVTQQSMSHHENYLNPEHLTVTDSRGLSNKSNNN